MKKRVLKLTTRRRPKERIAMNEMSKLISESTGFVSSNVREVLEEFFRIGEKSLFEKKQFYLGRLGIIYPVLNPPRLAQKLIPGSSKAIAIQSPARWHIKFQCGITLRKKMNKQSCTQEEIDNLYVDE